MAITKPAPTPGYNCRLRIAFTVDRKGNALAYYWSGRFAVGGFDGRWLRMGLDKARLFVAQEQADQVPYGRVTAASFKPIDPPILN